jgi:hypothetical protein
MHGAGGERDRNESRRSRDKLAPIKSLITPLPYAWMSAPACWLLPDKSTLDGGEFGFY